MPLTYEQVVESMGQPDLMTPRMAMDSLVFLTALYAQKHAELSDASIARGQLEARLITEGATSAAASKFAAVSEHGILETKLKGGIKSLEEMIRSLKKMLAYLSEESRNQF